jgi:hypothetical protein
MNSGSIRALTRSAARLTSVATAIACLSVWAASADAKATYIAFDVPGAAGTVPYSINNKGVVTGWSLDASHVPHGFVRSVDGTVTTFDAPGAVDGTLPMAIDERGTITGYYDNHAFIRAADGAISTFDTPQGAFTCAIAINRHGYIAGYDGEEIDGPHAFIRAPDGTLTMWKAPGSDSDIFAADINARQMVVGYYTDDFGDHGFLRKRNGNLTTVDVPGADGTKIQAINREGMVAGNATLGSGKDVGFVRDVDGTITTFDASGRGDFTTVSALTDDGEAIGYYLDRTKQSDRTRGFVRSADGTIERFDAFDNSGASTGVYGANNSGVAVGYTDTTDAGHGHGFIRMP